MNAKRKKKAISIIETEIQRLRDVNQKLCDDMGIELDDPVADVNIIEKSDHILLTYDGAGYEYFSIRTELPSTRKNLFSKMKVAGFHVEDVNNCSISIHEA